MNTFTKATAALVICAGAFFGASAVLSSILPGGAAACYGHGVSYGHGANAVGRAEGRTGGCPCPMCARGGALGPEDVDYSEPAAALYAKRCAACHALPSRKIHTAAEWEAVVTRMEGYARGHEKMMGPSGVAMSPGERRQVLDYLKAGAGR